MSRLSIDLFQLFVQPPGDFIYYLLVIGLSQATLMLALSQRRRMARHMGIQRYIGISSIVIAFWFMLLIAITMARFSSQIPLAIAPPLDRAVTVATLILLIWAMILPEKERASSGIRLFLGVILLITLGGCVFTVAQWMPFSELTDFNLTTLALGWSVILLAISVFGIVATIIAFQRIFDAPLKLLFMFLILVGSVVSIYQMVSIGLIGNYAGILRLSFLLALALVPVIVYRVIIRQFDAQLQTTELNLVYEDVPQPKTAIADKTTPVSIPLGQTPERIHTDTHSAQLLRALGLILETQQPTKIPASVTKTAIDLLRADVGVLLRLQDANYADCTVLLDGTRQHRGQGLSLNLDHQPTLVNAIERMAQRTLYPDRNADELTDLYTRIDIEHIGPAYIQPLVSNHVVLAILIIANPYTKKELTSSEKEFLNGIGIISSNLLALSYEAQASQQLAEDRVIQALVEGVSPSEINDDAARDSRKVIEESLVEARANINALNREVLQLKVTLDDERSRIANLLSDSPEDLSISQKILALNEEQLSLSQERDELAKRLQEAETILSGMTSTDSDTVSNNQYERLVAEREALELERNILKKQLDDLHANDRTIVPEIHSVLQDMLKERERLSQERNQLQHKLVHLESQLQTLGYDNESANLSDLINQLYQERSVMQQTLERIQHERDVLLTERQKLQSAITEEDERDARISSLQQKVENLASDREAMLRQQEKHKNQIRFLQEKLDQVKVHRARLLAQVSGMEIQLGEAHDELEQARIQVQYMADTQSEILNTQRQLQAENQTLKTERDQYLARLDDDPRRVNEVNALGIGTLKQMIDDLSLERQQLEWQLNDARTRLVSAEEKLRKKQRTNEKDISSEVPPTDQANLMMSLVQDFRTPLTSIIGYLDLLLGESAGILGEMQRKFLQRVTVNVDRLETMIEDMIQIIQLDSGQIHLAAVPINVIRILENAITSESLHYREKEIIVNMDLPDDLPLIEADHDAVVQIISQLLSNAYLASPPASEIAIVAASHHIDADESQIPAIRVSVTDSGGGIDTDDLPRVFSRKYKADNPLISGLGDTGVGLAIAKALVDAHHGEFWVTSEVGKGSTFHIALPINDEVPK